MRSLLTWAVSALREVLPDQTVGVLVRAAFPAVIRPGEVDGAGERRADLLVGCERLAVVDRDALHRLAPVGQGVDHRLPGLPGRSRLDLADGDHAALALHHRDGPAVWCASGAYEPRRHRHRHCASSHG